MPCQLLIFKVNYELPSLIKTGREKMKSNLKNETREGIGQRIFPNKSYSFLISLHFVLLYFISLFSDSFLPKLTVQDVLSSYTYNAFIFLSFSDV